MSVYVDEHLGLQDFVQALLVHEIEVKNSSVLIYKPIKKKSSLANNNANQRKFCVQTQTKEKENGATLKL